MKKNTVIELAGRDTISDPLTEMRKAGARRRLQQAAELQETVAGCAQRVRHWLRLRVARRGLPSLADLRCISLIWINRHPRFLN